MGRFGRKILFTAKRQIQHKLAVFGLAAHRMRSVAQHFLSGRDSGSKPITAGFRERAGIDSLGKIDPRRIVLP